MKYSKRLSNYTLAILLAVGSMAVACQPAAVNTPNNSASVAPNASTSATNTAVTGVVYSSLAADGRFVPPTSPVSISIKDPSNSDKVLATAQTDALGRFYLSNINVPASTTTTSTQGQEVLIDIPDAKYKRALKIFPGRVLNLSAIQITTFSNNEQTRSISGSLLSPDQKPLANAVVRDKKFPFRSVTTDSSGQFLLDVVSSELEVLVGQSSLPITITTQDVVDKKILTVPIGNIRLITGTIKDSTNSNVFLGEVKVRVAGTTVSAITDANGKYSLNGAPLVPFTLEIEPPNSSYSAKSIQIGPATTENKDKPVLQDVSLQPIGTVQVNFMVESAPGFNQPLDNPLGCQEDYNCKRFDLDGNPNTALNPVYHNSLGVLNELSAQINIEGTEIRQEVAYPPSVLLDVLGVDSAGDVKVFPAAVRSSNFVVSVLLDKVPGGRQNVTISLTGMQTQKSISVFVPPKDTISTDLITLFRVQPAFGIGDVTGKLTLLDSKGKEVTNPDILTKVRIGYLDVSDELNFLPSASERNPELQRRIKDTLAGDVRAIRLGSISGQDKNNYYIKNVSTGSRVLVVAGLVDGATVLEDCFVPNEATLLNVKPGTINFAPDLTLTLRPLPGCGG
jgi:hypothetical protein